MRAFCTVSAPLEVCASSAEQLSPGSRFLALRLLGNQQPKTLYFLVDAKSRVREVYTQTCLHFATQGMLDTELFGLAVLIDGEYMFADPESKLSKYGPKSWRSSHTHGLDANGRPLLELHFRVQFYIESPFMLKDESSKHNYYLQLKYNALQRDIPREYSEQSMILLAGLALQADFGDAPIITNKTKATNKKTIKNEANDAQATTTTTLIETKSNLANNDSNILSTVAEATAATTTTLPKINKRKSNANNERMLRLSTHITAVVSDSGTECTKGNIKLSNNAAPTTTTTPEVSAAAKEILVAASSSSCSSNSARSALNTPEAEYFRVEDYLPEGLRSAWAVSALRACHRENRGMSMADAELHYIQQACLVHESINAHTFRMRMSKHESGAGSSWFVVYAKGIKILHMLEQPQLQQQQQQQQFINQHASQMQQLQQQQQQQQQTTFLWPNITKLSFERKKFEIRSGDSKITLYASSDEKNKMLLTLCKETHQFSMKIAARLKEVIKRDEEESNCLHACYIYSRSLHMLYKNKNDQRISVISSTSSNTTSGIVSDRVHSEDELEIMINTPPAPIAAPSTESLALAHLLDRPSVSRQTSSVGQVSLKDLEEQLAALSVRQAQQQLSNNSCGESSTELSNTSAGNSSSSQSGGSIPTSCSQRQTNSSTATDSPNSQHNKGSQCSSTCSTVVVAATTNAESLSSLAVHTVAAQRRNSTSSSLELGFSHTAQNSTLSEAASTCIEHDFLPSTHDSESVSGVYTLAHGAPLTETSGVYTMHSSELTGQNSEIAESEKSSQYGIFQPNNNGLEQSANSSSKRLKEEDFRLRCDSNVSASGSFRGDGSDPTDNSHTLLTAKELTALIVGRGTYPSCKTVAATLDSDCDYVTLPMPMSGESYIKGHQDTAPTEDQVVNMISDLLPVDPPAPPQRLDSNGINSTPPYAQLNKLRMRSPPPYNARHEKTGLCGPPISHKPQEQLTEAAKSVISTPNAAAILRRRDPPPYPKALKQRPSSLMFSKAAAVAAAAVDAIEPQRISLSATTRQQTEEVPARIITSRPQINILKAHTSLINENHKPSYAAPTNLSSSAGSQHMPSHLSQNSNYSSSSQTASLNLGRRNHMPLMPLVPYSLHAPHKSMSSLLHQAPPPPPPYPEMKSATPHACVLLPVIKPQQYLPPPPPPSLPRQPPPPPPSQLAAAVYGKQLELYQQQLYSDVDYVIYPIQDPAVSQQEYLDAKQGSLLAAMAAQNPPPPHPHAHSYLAAYHHHHSAWDTCKAHAIYRSTPYLPLALSHAHSRYASTQNLSDTYVQLPSACSPLYSPSLASLCSSFEPPPPPPLHPATLAAAANAHNATNLFVRSRSDDNILNSLDSLPKMKRLPPPPPPPYVNRRLKKPPMPTPIEKPPPIPSKPASVLRHQLLPPRKPPTLSATRSGHTHMTKTSSGAQWAGERPKPELPYSSRSGSTSLLAQLQASMAAASNNRQRNMENATTTTTTTTQGATAATTNSSSTNALDIAALREKSRHLDLPLISALCNDRSLLKQTKVLLNAKSNNATTTTTAATALATTTTTTAVANTTTMTTTTTATPTINKTMDILIPNTNIVATSNTNTTITTTTTMPTSNKISSSSKMRKSSISHRHPNDKLPPLPMQSAEANNYVMDPAVLKHQKSYNNNNSNSNNNGNSNSQNNSNNAQT